MKKIVALILCLVMVGGLMAGCQKTMDVKTLAQKMDEAARNMTAMAGKFDIEMEMSMGITGMTMTVGLKADGEMKADIAAKDIYADVDATVEMLGESEEMGIELYSAAAEDGSSVMYIHDGSTDSWVKYTQENDGKQVEELQGMVITMSEVPEEKLTLAEEKQTVDGVECYVLTMELNGTYFTDGMKAMMQTAAESMDEASAAMMESIDWSALNAKAVYYVDAKTFNTVQMDMEILGLGDMMSGIMDAAMADLKELLGGEEVEVTIDVPVCKIAMSGMTYTGVEVPTVPQEGIDNAIDTGALTEEPDIEEDVNVDDILIANPPQADGSFLLRHEDMTARVLVPERYVVYMSEENALTLINKDMTVYVTYALVGETDAAAMEAEFEDLVQIAKDDGYWLSNSDGGDISGFTVKNLAYNDDTAEIYAWKEVAGGIMLVNSSCHQESPDMQVFLNGVEIG